MIVNIHKLREKLDAGDLCLGAGVTLADPAVTEALCQTSDFLWIDLEHNPIDFGPLLSLLIAARAGGAPALVRIPSGDEGWIKRTLDSGAEGIILPRANTVQEIQDFVSACRYPPLGCRGFGPRRPTQYGRFGGSEYVQHANQHLFTVVQIETVATLEAIDEIVQMDGLDAIIVGPNDLSGSLGMLGELEHPQVLDAIATIAKSCQSAGKYLGIGMDANPDYAVKVAKLGVQFVQCGGDVTYLLRYCDNLFADIRQKFDK